MKNMITVTHTEYTMYICETIRVLPLQHQSTRRRPLLHKLRPPVPRFTGIVQKGGDSRVELCNGRHMVQVGQHECPKLVLQPDFTTFSSEKLRPASAECVGNVATTSKRARLSRLSATCCLSTPSHASIFVTVNNIPNRTSVITLLTMAVIQLSSNSARACCCDSVIIKQYTCLLL